ncbi:hypothetical protein AALO_G00001310 [Alosa alosa]|uniref:Uncharacterized protein n=1 Tax=Alosa alosa TaxID=278164 RepID=A0AAV6HD89_9TELE|nr:hypothetical protein AALO_G00001310 [Alosa alosa]
MYRTAARWLGTAALTYERVGSTSTISAFNRPLMADLRSWWLKDLKCQWRPLTARFLMAVGTRKDYHQSPEK